MRLSLKRINWYPKAYFASVGPAMSEFHDKLKSDANYVFSSSQWEHSGGGKTPGCNEFYNAYIHVYNEEPSYHAATAYAGGQILEAAIKKAGSLDREKIRGILLSMDAISIIGRYGVDKQGMQIKHFNIIVQWQNGKKGCLARGPENSRPDIQMREFLKRDNKGPCIQDFHSTICNSIDIRTGALCIRTPLGIRLCR